MKIPTKNEKQMYIWIIVIVLIVILIGVLIWMFSKKKEDYIKIDENEYYEEYENFEEVENYFMDGYAIEYVENFELLNMTNSHCHPLNEHFNKILHIANIICHTDDLEEISREAKRIDLDNDFINRVLKDKDSTQKFSRELHIQLAKHHHALGKVVEKIAPEIFEKVKKQVNIPKVEKFSLECYEKNNLTQIIEKQDRIISKLKKTLKICLLKRMNRYNLFHNPDIRKYARHANIYPHILIKIIESKDNIERFLNNELTLEYYDPESFIENYSIWGKIKGGFEKAGSAIKGGFEKAGKAIKDTAIKAGKAIKDTAEIVGNKIKDAALTVGKFVKETAGKIKDGVVKAYEKVKKFAEETFDKIKIGIQKGIHEAIKGIKYVINKIGDAAKKAWEAIKDAFSKAGHWIVDFAKSTFKSIMDQFLRVINVCKEGVPEPCITYQINDKSLKLFLLNKFQTILYSTFLTPIAWVFEIPLVGSKIKKEISKLIMPAFDAVWKPMRPVVSDIVTSIIHTISPDTKNFKLEFTEWFSMINYIREKFQIEVETGEFENNFKEYIRKTIHQRKEEKYQEKIEINDYKTFKNLQNLDKIDKIYHILHDKIKPELKIHLKKIIQNLLEIS